MHAKIRLSRLRDIGWTYWDPIGLLEEGAPWEGEPFADEYDTYLMQAAAQLRRGVSEKEVIDFLCRVERDHMGLNAVAGQRGHVRKVVRAIQADKDLWTYPPDPKCRNG